MENYMNNLMGNYTSNENIDEITDNADNSVNTENTNNTIVNSFEVHDFENIDNFGFSDNFINPNNVEMNNAEMNNAEMNNAEMNNTEMNNTEMNNVQNAARFGSFQGIVRSVRYFFDENNNIVENYYFMDVSNGETLVVFLLTPDTYYADCNIQAGDEVIGYYRSDQPMTLIYPPRLNIKVLVRANEGRNIKVDYFDQNLISSDGMLMLNITQETYIINEYGRPYCRDITNKDLFVIYGASTRSIPAMTTPSVIVVLS